MNFPIGFGTWPLGGRAYGTVKESVAISALEQAINYGVRLFDTANIYGDGRAEKLLGKAVSGVPDALIVSKAGYIAEMRSEQDFTKDYLEASLEGSLRRLNRSYLDIFLLHSPHRELLLDGQIFDIMNQMKKQGIVKKTGVSLRSVNDFKLALKWSECQVIEVILNLLDQRPIDTGLLDLAGQRGIEIIARVPLCFGILTGKYKVGSVFSVGDQRSRWTREQIDSWIKGAECFNFIVHSGRSLAQAAIAFCVRCKGVTYTIPGMKTPEQVHHNVVSCQPNYRLTDAELSHVRKLWSGIKELPQKAR
ncbi:MAG: aldo/keto reductase [Hormoscilla sp. GM7CHS1pb]|nr:aldo/keto reductase [Hormoscilla sp. GM7CHS1pb]